MPEDWIGLAVALGVAALLLAVSVLVSWLRAQFGVQGALGADTALQALLVAVGVNSTSRGIVAFDSGGPAYGLRVTVALLVSAGAALAALLLAARFTTLG